MTVNCIDITAWHAEHRSFDPSEAALGRVRPEPTTISGLAIRALDAPAAVSPRWRVQALIPDGDFGIVAGEDGVSKSTISLHIAAAIAGGYKVFDWFLTDPGPTLVVSEEDDAATINLRLETRVGDPSVPTWREMMRARDRLTSPFINSLRAYLSAKAAGETLPAREQPDPAAERDREIVQAYDTAHGLHSDGAKEELARRIRVIRDARGASHSDMLPTYATAVTTPPRAPQQAPPAAPAEPETSAEATTGSWRILLPDGRRRDISVQRNDTRRRE